MTILEKGMATRQEDHLIGERAAEFESQQVVMDQIMENGVAEYVKTLPNLSDAFDPEKHKPAENLHACLCCMDGRTPFGKHLPGSGILLSENEFKKSFINSGADSISSHDGCGAARKFAEENGLDVNLSDQIGKEWAEKMAREMGVEHIHLGVEGHHQERACYFDKTGKFNFGGVVGLPNGFIVSDLKGISKESSMDAIKLAIGIAFGDHGFGEYFLNEKNPFILIAVADEVREIEKMKDELTKLAEPFGTKVVVDGFLAPEGV